MCCGSDGVPIKETAAFTLTLSGILPQLPS